MEVDLQWPLQVRDGEVAPRRSVAGEDDAHLLDEPLHAPRGEREVDAELSMRLGRPPDRSSVEHGEEAAGPRPPGRGQPERRPLER
jgi:hypothetical protein